MNKGMNQTDRRLRRHVITAVAIKLIALAALWQLFVRDERIIVDTERAAMQLGVAAQPAPAQGASK